MYEENNNEWYDKILHWRINKVTSYLLDDYCKYTRVQRSALIIDNNY